MGLRPIERVRLFSLEIIAARLNTTHLDTEGEAHRRTVGLRPVVPFDETRPGPARASRHAGPPSDNAGSSARESVR